MGEQRERVPTEREAMDYVATMSRELSAIAERKGRRVLASFLTMAAAEAMAAASAEDQVRSGISTRRTEEVG